MDTKVLNALLCAFLVIPLAGSIAPPTVMTLDEQGLLLIEEGLHSQLEEPVGKRRGQR